MNRFFTSIASTTSTATAVKAFKTVVKEDINFFKKNVKSISVKKDEMEKYTIDWTGAYKQSSPLLLKPETTKEVSEILKYCSLNRLPVVPQGGNTGLVGGSIPLAGNEIIISMEKMSKIHSFDPISGVITAEAGAILEIMDDFLKEKGHQMPLDLGAKGSCQIGGCISTNAGGLRVLRYGNLHGTMVGIEVVLADGSILKENISLPAQKGQSLIKNNVGYDLKQLFCGSEGTLGIITNVSIQCKPSPKSTQVALLEISSSPATPATTTSKNSAIETISEIFLLAKESLGECLSAFEFWDKESETPSASSKMKEGDFRVLIECQGQSIEHDTAKMMCFIDRLIEKDLIGPLSTLAQDSSQVKGMWLEREGIPEHASHMAKGPSGDGKVLKYDISLPQSLMYEPVKWCRELLGKDSSKFRDVKVIGFGHFGDGNLHLNLLCPSLSIYAEVKRLLEPKLFHLLRDEWMGSMSAEHGIGQAKAAFLDIARSKTELELMRSIKMMMDPQGILNPGKIFNK